jgi:hypothetical protein
MTLQPDRLAERANRNFDDRQLSCAGFLDMAKAFDTVWAKGFLYKANVLNFLSYPVEPYHRTLNAERSKRPSSEPRPHVVSWKLG